MYSNDVLMYQNFHLWNIYEDCSEYTLILKRIFFLDLYVFIIEILFKMLLLCSIL